MKLEFCEQMQEFRLKFGRFGDTLVFVKQWHCAAVRWNLFRGEKIIF